MISGFGNEKIIGGFCKSYVIRFWYLCFEVEVFVFLVRRRYVV